MADEIGWEVFGDKADTKIVQTGKGQSYHEAKEKAIKLLRAFLEPLENRLCEINQDLDLERNKIPLFKAWQSNNVLVVARTKKRAAELAGDSLSTFSRWHTRCIGHWWYPFAQNEGVWEQGKNGTWEKSLSWEEQMKAACQDTVT